MPPVGGSAAYRQREPNNLASSVGRFIGRSFCVQAKDKLRPTWRPSAGSPQQKCTPSAYGTSPRESVSRNFQSPYGSLQISFACHPGGGGLLSASLSANLSRSLYSGARSSPFGGKVVRQHQKGCISLAPKARLACFPTGESPVVWFYHTGALHFQRAPTTLDPDLRSLLYCLTSLSPHMTPNSTHQYTRG